MQTLIVYNEELRSRKEKLPREWTWERIAILGVETAEKQEAAKKEEKAA